MSATISMEKLNKLPRNKRLEISLNLTAKQFTPSELVKIGRRIEEIEAEEAKGRELAGKRIDPKENLPEGRKGQTRDHVAAALGMSGKTYEKAKRVIESGKQEIVQKLDKGEISVDRAYREIRTSEVKNDLKEKAEALSMVQTEPVQGEYDVIVIDPPWPIQKIERDCRPNQTGLDYPTMAEEKIHYLDIPHAKNCHLWIWTTQRFLPSVFQMIHQRRFTYVCTFVWHKPGGFQPIGLPQYNCEFALYVKFGKPQFIDTKAFPVCFNAPRGAHSEKPEEFYQIVRRVTVGRRLDMFGRRKIEGFDSWGNEA